MEDKHLKIINMILIMSIVFGLAAVSPWVIMWLTFLSSGASHISWVFKVHIIVLFRNIFLLGWIVITVGVLLLITINFVIRFNQKIE